MSRCSPRSIIAVFHTTGLLSLPQSEIRAGKLLVDPGHLQEERLGGRPHHRYKRAHSHRPVVDRALQKKHILLMTMAKKLPKTIVSLKWRVFKLCCPAHLFPNTPRTISPITGISTALAQRSVSLSSCITTVITVAIYGPISYAAQYKCFWCGKIHYEGKWEGGWALENETFFLGPVKWHWAVRRVPFHKSKALCTGSYRSEVHWYLCTWAPKGDFNELWSGIVASFQGPVQ